MEKTIRNMFVLMCLLMVFVIGCSQQPLIYQTIQEAAGKGNLDDVKRHLQKGAAVNAEDNEGNTPLICAAVGGHLDVVKFLVAKGADINARNAKGMSPMSVAVKESYGDVVKFLRRSGVNHLKQYKDVNASDKDGYTPLHSAVNSFHLYHNLNEVKYLVFCGAKVNAKTKYGETPLMMASEEGHLEIVKFLMDNGAKVNAKTKYGETPLMMAAKSGHLEIVKLLVSKGVDLKVQDYGRYTPLHWAAFWGHIDVVKFLLDNGMDVNIKNAGGWTLLRHSTWICWCRSLDPKCNTGITPLHMAASKNKLEVVKFLVNKGANINAKDTYGETSLEIATNKGHQAIVEFLNQNGTKE